jgi:HSP20 family protein
MAIRDLIPWRKRREGREREGDRLPARSTAQEMFRDMMEDFFGEWGEFPAHRGEGRLAPAIDVRETEQEYRVSVELPGMTKDDIELTVDQGRLHVRGEKREEQREEEEDYLRVERSYGSFSRTIPLPSTVEEEDIEASYKDGVLDIHLPKTGQAPGRRVEIQGESR